jgi:hypothetical protein
VNLSLGGGKRTLVVASTMLALTALSACSGDSEPKDESSSTPSASATPDASAEVKALVSQYWDTVTQAENSADTDRAQFKGVARGAFLENEFRKLDNYADQGINRVGGPRITAVEVAVDGNTAVVSHCIDEDQWTAKKNGEALKPILTGNRPFGLTATLTGDAWIVTDTGLTKAQEKAKDCS